MKTPEEVAARLVSLQPKSCRQRSQAGSSREYLQAVGDGVEEAGRRSSNADPHAVEEVRDAGVACEGRAGRLGKPDQGNPRPGRGWGCPRGQGQPVWRVLAPVPPINAALSTALAFLAPRPVLMPLWPQSAAALTLVASCLSSAFT